LLLLFLRGTFGGARAAPRIPRKKKKKKEGKKKSNK